VGDLERIPSRANRDSKQTAVSALRVVQPASVSVNCIKILHRRRPWVCLYVSLAAPFVHPRPSHSRLPHTLQGFLFGTADTAVKAQKKIVKKAKNEAYMNVEGVGVLHDANQNVVGVVHRHTLPLPWPPPALNAGPWNVIKQKKKTLARVSLVDEPDQTTQSVRIDYAPGEVGASSGWGFHAAPKHAFPSVTSSLSYRVYFPEEFDWRRGGKLPGLCVLSSTSASAARSPYVRLAHALTLSLAHSFARQVHRASGCHRRQLGVQGRFGKGGLAA